jgi:predicted nucleic acid-binding protein
MSNGIRRIYWDADVLVSYVEDVPDRAPMIEGLLAQARANDIELVTSVISIAEVAYAETERLRGALSPDIEQRIEGLWAIGSPLKVAEVYPLITTRARNLIRDSIPRGWTGLKAHDAIHLATAQQLQVEAIHSYDAKWPKYAEVLGVPISEPETDRPTLL